VADRQAIVLVAIRGATGIDTRDWPRSGDPSVFEIARATGERG
jgi:hypothetical protein